MLVDYEPNVLMGNENYEYSGIIGECEDYDAYKAALDVRREKMRQKMILCNGKKKEKWYRQRANLWAKCRKRARELIKA